MPKKNPQLSHHQWMEIHLETIKKITKLEAEKVDLTVENQTLVKDKMKLTEELMEKWKEVEELKNRENVLKEELEKQTEVAQQFLLPKRKKVLLSGDSHLKAICKEKLEKETGRSIEILKTYNSRDNWPNALKPSISISSVLLENVKSRATNLVLTSPTSDITNLRGMSKSEQIKWIDLSAKTVMSTAETCLIRYPALMKVSIVEHLPR